MKILGLDIGSSSIKAIDFDVTFGRVELYNYVIEPVAERPLSGREVLSPAQVDALTAILKKRSDRSVDGARVDRLVVNLPRAWVTSRVFYFPTKDRKTLQNSLNFELDDEIPFSMDEILYDFATIHVTGNTSTVFASMALKKDVLSLVSALQMLGLDPDMITTEAWGMGYLLKRSLPKNLEAVPTCVVNIGHHQTSIQIFVGAHPFLTHICQHGGVDITRAIAKRYNISYDEAERAKVDGAFLITQTHLGSHEPLSEDQKIFSSVIEEALVPVLRDIKQTIISYKAQYKHAPAVIYLTGGTSLIPNLPLYFEEILSIPVFRLAFISSVVGQTLQLSESSEAQIACASGLALSMVKVDRGHNINFRKDELAKTSGLGAFNFTLLKRPLKYVAATLAFIYLNLIVQGIVLSSRESSQQAQLERSIKSVLGASSPAVISNYLRSPSMLRNAVKKELAKYKTSQVAPSKPQVSAFDVLNKVSSLIPRDMTLDMNNFQLKDGNLKLSGLVESPLQSDRITKALEGAKIFKEVSKTKEQEDLKTRRRSFEITAKLAENAAKELSSGKIR